MEKKIFTRKPYNSFLYKWSPETSIVKKPREEKLRAQFCDAIKFSQGEDWNVTYVYDLVYNNGAYHRYAYVECDYVE